MRRLNLTGNNFDSLVSRFRSEELDTTYPTPQENYSEETRVDNNVNLQENDIDSLINDLVGVEPSEDINDIIDDAADIIEESVAPQEEVKEELTPEDEINKKIKDIEKRTTERTVVKQEVLRFSGAEWFSKTQEQTIILGGAGGISSYVLYNLAKLHPASIYVYDFDVVERVNIAGQLFKLTDIGRAKVDAITSTAIEFSGFQNIFAIPDSFDESTEPSKVMICGFDNMEARKAFFKSWIRGVRNAPANEKSKYLLIDGRLSAEKFQVFAITGDNTWAQEEYKKEYLFSDSEAEQTVCSFKQTAFMANMIGGYITNLFVNFCANLCDFNIERPLPFKSEYAADTMFLITEN